MYENSFSLINKIEKKMNFTQPITTEFAVQMKCPNCSNQVKKALSSFSLNKLDISIPQQTVVIESLYSPSKLLSHIRSTGLVSTLRGISSPFTVLNSPYTLPTSAVCIFESFHNAQQGWAQDVNKGLARLVQLSESIVLIDLVVEGLQPLTDYSFEIRECGDLSQGAESTGDCWKSIAMLTSNTQGQAEWISEIDKVALWECIGRSLVLKPVNENSETNSIAGIIARSSHIFQNSKKICSCSGKTLWEEASRL